MMYCTPGWESLIYIINDQTYYHWSKTLIKKRAVNVATCGTPVVCPHLHGRKTAVGLQSNSSTSL